jgi:hypothetical protein
MPSRPLQSRIFNIKGCQGSGERFRTAYSNFRVVKVLGTGFRSAYSTFRVVKGVAKGLEQHVQTLGLSRYWDRVQNRIINF